MENKKLLKFLYKDIAEIEELFQEKGAEGFDEYEIEFIETRFKGAKQIVKILSDKENGQDGSIQSQLKSQMPDANTEIVKENSEQVNNQEKAGLGERTVSEISELPDEAKQSLESLAEFEEELKVEKKSQTEPAVEEHKEEDVADVKGNNTPPSDENISPQKEEPEVGVEVSDEAVSDSDDSETGVDDEKSDKPKDELKEKPTVKTKTDDAQNRLGDSFSKEKSVNEVLAANDNKLEHKISNSPVDSLKTAIGINDRYQYIRELFDGDADTFSNAITEIDKMQSINEAVSYIQQNYKWQKNETSLKFVNLVKRRFPNE